MKGWEKQERDLARRRGGVRTRGSGSGWRQRQDVREGRSILWEAKQTAGVSITLSLAVWAQLRKNAMMEGAMPALAIRLGDVDLVVISQDDFDAAYPPSTG